MSNAITGHAALVYPSKYIKAADLHGKDVTVVIAEVAWEDLVMAGGKRDRKVAITMKGPNGRPLEKKWIVGKTGVKQIVLALGETMVERWIGQKVTIFPTTCKGQAGDEVECIRVRARATKAASEPTASMTAPVPVEPPPA